MHPPPRWSLCSFILALWLGSHQQPNVACAKHLQHRCVSFPILIRNSSSSLSLRSSTIYLARIYSLIRHSRNSISIPPFPISTNISHSQVLASALAISTAFPAHIFGLQTHSFLNPALLGTHSFRPPTHTFPDSIRRLYGYLPYLWRTYIHQHVLSLHTSPSAANDKDNCPPTPCANSPIS